MKIDAVFSGGGVKAYAFIGALQSIERNNLFIERVAGTSAGAIIASLIAAKYRIAEIKQLVQELDLKKLLDAPTLVHYFPFTKWPLLFYQMGVYRGDALERWLYNILAAKEIFTFADLQDEYLKVIVSDLTLGKLVIIPDDLQKLYNIDPKNFPISTAVRMSAGFPFFFMPKKLISRTNKKSLMVDGGILSNFPLWIFDNKDKKRRRPILGVKLSEEVNESKQREINNAFQMFHALFSTMKTAHDARYISKEKENNIIFIPVHNLHAVDFSIEQSVMDKLIIVGEQSANDFLRYWST